jgi:putative FmdB family regulatory protein
MPIYEYACLDCGERFEMIRAMKDADAPLTCRKCESQHTARLLSLFNASSSRRVVAGSNGGCASCNSGSCATCGR